MDHQRVLEALAVLRAELADADGLHPSARASLGQLSEDIQRLADERKTAGFDDHEAASALKDSLVEFETVHPQLTGAINQVAAALANLGI